jgi:hypothetical protein
MGNCWILVKINYHGCNSEVLSLSVCGAQGKSSRISLSGQKMEHFVAPTTLILQMMSLTCRDRATPHTRCSPWSMGHVDQFDPPLSSFLYCYFILLSLFSS